MEVSKQDSARQTLVVFGATGTTGSHVLRQALDGGISVRAAVRSPNKLPPNLVADQPQAKLGRNQNSSKQSLRESDRLEVATVDVTDTNAVARAIQGATMVFAALGYTGDPGRPVLLPFVQAVVQAMREHGARRFVYQASAFNSEPGQSNPVHIRYLLRPLVGSIVGAHPIWNEHDAVIRFLVEEVSDLEWTVTRPGMLSDGQSKGVLAVRATPGGGVTNRDLATFSLNAVRTGDHARSCPYLGYP
ncbi:MAG: NAD(P)H-binding protein [Myxococcota bacterium]